MLMDTEIKQLESKILQACLVDIARTIRQDMDSHTTALEYCRG